MKKKEAWKHLNKQWKKLEHYFKQFTRSEAPEDLHQFRVYVKKIRSFLTLLEFGKENKDLLKHFKPVKQIFKLAGIIRDAYLHQQEATAHYIQLPRYYEEQHNLQTTGTKKLISKRKKYIAQIKKVKKKLKQHLHSIAEDEIETFFREQIDNTGRILSTHSFSEDLHNGRKMLKHLIYNKQLVYDGLAKALHINFGYIDELQEVLGKWHDNKLALEFFSDQKLDTKEVDSMKEKNKKLEKVITEKAKGFKQRVSKESAAV